MDHSLYLDIINSGSHDVSWDFCLENDLIMVGELGLSEWIVWNSPKSAVPGQSDIVSVSFSRTGRRGWGCSVSGWSSTWRPIGNHIRWCGSIK